MHHILGSKRTQEQINHKHRNHTAKYALCDQRGHCIDANAALRFVNDPQNTDYILNTVFYGNNYNMYLDSTCCCIPANQEIFTNYGDDYWTNN